MTRKEKQEKAYDYLCKLLDKGMRRTEAISEVQKKFMILHPQTVYNYEKREKAIREGRDG